MKWSFLLYGVLLLAAPAAPTSGRGKAKKEAPAKDFKAVLRVTCITARKNLTWSSFRHA